MPKTWTPAEPALLPFPIVIDRTALELYWRCPRLFWWARRFWAPGTPFAGLEPPEAEYRVFGKAVHKMIELGVQAMDPLAVAGMVGNQIVHEMATENEVSRVEYLNLVQGMSVVWADRVLPTLLKKFKVLACEEELHVDFLWHNNQDYMGSKVALRVMVIPDLVLQEISTGRIVYFEWKTTAWGPDAGATDQWDKSPQIQLGMQAIKQKYGRCDGAIVGLFYKGQKRGYRSSPFCYGYVKGSLVSPRYKAGWERVSVAELLLLKDWTMLDWVNQFDEELWTKQFWSTGLLTESPWIVESMQAQLPQLAMRMRSLAQTQYPQAWSACTPPLAGACGFVLACHTPLGLHPLTVYKPREPHHQSEPPLTLAS